MTNLLYSGHRLLTRSVGSPPSFGLDKVPRQTMTLDLSSEREEIIFSSKSLPNSAN